MKVSRFIANQYANPTGWFGKYLTAWMLNRANRKSNFAVFNALSIDTNDRFLEIGFGGADLLFSVTNCGKCSEVWGIEKSTSMLERANARIHRLSAPKNIQLMPGDIANLPVDSGYFDKVCSVNTIYFWKDLNHGAAEIARVTAPGGKVVLGFSAGETLRQSGYENRGFSFYTLEQVHHAMGSAGLTLVHVHLIERRDKDPFLIPVYLKNA